MHTSVTKLPDPAGASASASSRVGAPAQAQAQSPRPSASAAAQALAALAASTPSQSDLNAANEHLARLDSRLRFSVDEATDRVVVSIVDRETSEVLRQFPSEEMLALSRRLEAMADERSAAAGVLIDDLA